jgi:trehalose 6-phosphate phosphatase
MQPLPVPATADGRAGLAALLARPAHAIIAVDFDGTLSPIVPDPEAARATPAATAALRRLAPVLGGLAIITGRPARDAAERAGVAGLAGLTVLGLYGRQRLAGDVFTAPPPPPGLARAKAELPAVVAAAGADGSWIEDKGDSVAVHTRRTADPAGMFGRLRAPMARLADQTGLTLGPGRLVFELLPPGPDKGQALRELARGVSARAVMFCGDDVGDLPAFAAVRELRAEGTPGLAVCSGSAEVPEVAAEADLLVDGPAEVADLLMAIADALGVP